MLPFKGLRKTCLIDYPPYTSAVVYLAGCNLRCPFCHNGSLVVGHEALAQIPEQEIMEFLEKRKMWLDAVVISGGEPTLQAELPDFCRRLKAMGYKVKLDTNGTKPEMLKQLINEKCVDFIAMDIKNSPAKYPLSVMSEVDMAAIAESIRLLIDSGIKHEFRTTAVPGHHEESDFKEIGEMVNGAKAFSIQQFRPKDCLDPAFDNIKPFAIDVLNRFKTILDKNVGDVVIKNQ